MPIKPRQIFVGTILYGYCNGYFGRDSYGPKRVEGVGEDWLVARDNIGRLYFATFANHAEMLQAANDNNWFEEEL